MRRYRNKGETMNAEEIIGKVLKEEVIKKVKSDIDKKELDTVIDEVINDVNQIQNKIRDIMKKIREKSKDVNKKIT